MAEAILGLAIAAAVTLLGDQATEPSQVERLREACLSTDMKREAFERLLSPKGFEPLLQVVRLGEPEPRDWMVGYEDRGVQIVLSGKPEFRAIATDCGVSDPRPQGDWRADVTALANELGMRPAVPIGLSGTTEARSWTTTDERSLTLNYEVYGQAVVIRFAQPVPAPE